MNHAQQERHDRARTIAERWWAKLPVGEEHAPENARIYLQSRIASRIATRAEEGVDAWRRPAQRGAPYQQSRVHAGEQKFEETKQKRAIAVIADAFEKASKLLEAQSVK